MDFIVDLQGFKRPINEFVLKEISFVELDSDVNDEPLTLFFEPPTPWKTLPAQYKAMNSWLERNFHGMQWSSGNIPYEATTTIIRAVLKRARIIYVKGLEKTIWLRRFMDLSTNIVDMESLDCPSLQKLPKISPNSGCSYHVYDSKYNCSNANVKSLRSWLKVYRALCNRMDFWNKNNILYDNCVCLFIYINYGSGFYKWIFFYVTTCEKCLFHARRRSKACVKCTNFSHPLLGLPAWNRHFSH